MTFEQINRFIDVYESLLDTPVKKGQHIVSRSRLPQKSLKEEHDTPSQSWKIGHWYKTFKAERTMYENIRKRTSENMLSPEELATTIIVNEIRFQFCQGIAVPNDEHQT